MLVVDTSELKRPTQRKLHAAWQELHGQQVRATPGVAAELAPMAVDSIWTDGPSAAQRELKSAEARLPARRRNELEQQVWWADMWRDPHSPYQVVKLTGAQERLAESIRTEIDPRCFPTTDPDDIPDLSDGPPPENSRARAMTPQYGYPRLRRNVGCTQGPPSPAISGASSR